MKRVKLELVGLDSNAFSIMGAFKRAASEQGWTTIEINSVINECMRGDYDHLLATIISNTQSPDKDSFET